MHDELNAILRLYGESGTEGDSPATPTEAEDFASVKAALDRLPRQRPDGSVVDAVVAAAGEAARAAALGPVRTLYDEATEPLLSEQAEAEAIALAQMKAALDALPPQRPAASVIDAVVAAAVAPSPGTPPVTARAADRPVERPTRRRVVAVLSAAFAVVLVFGGGLWMNRDAASPQEIAADRFESEQEVVADAPLVAEAPRPEDALAEASESVAEPVRERAQAAATPPAAPSTVSNRSVQADDLTRADERVASARRAADAPPASALVAPSVAADADGLTLASEETLPLADGDEELQLLYLRVREMQAAQAGLGWDTPPVSLGAEPDSTPAATGWMQVRVQR